MSGSATNENVAELQFGPEFEQINGQSSSSPFVTAANTFVLSPLLLPRQFYRMRKWQ